MSYYNPYNNSNIEVIQHNTARLVPAMHTCLERAFKANIDFVLIQEPWIANDNKGTVSYSAYNSILPNIIEDIRPRVAIFALKATPYSYTARPDIVNDPDLLILQISGASIGSFQLINLYTEKGLGVNRDWTIKRSLQDIKPDKRTIICGDFNAHHSWWNSTISSPIRTIELIPWLERYSFELKNIEDQATFLRSNTENLSIIDLTFATKAIETEIGNWYIDEEAGTGSDHEVIRFSIYTSSTKTAIDPLKLNSYNLKKADWVIFKEILVKEQPRILDFFLNLSTKNKLEEANKRVIS
jgi:hypothetical protein